MKYEAALKLSSDINKQYEGGKSYKKQMGFTDKWPEYERFKAGDQWPAVTDRTKNLPRPVFNVIRYIENHKVSSVANENIKMLFTTQEVVDEGAEQDPATPPEVVMAADAAEKFTRFSDTTWENIKQDELNEEALESASNIGTGIWHYFWDPKIKGGLTQPWIGEMCGETLDAMNVFFGNPQSRDVQKQPYILISSREMVETVRKEAEANGEPEHRVLLIKGDKEVQDEGYDSAKHEVSDTDKATVLTRYWKKDGRVMFCKVSGSVVVKPPTDTGMKRYPIVVMQWERRKKSIFGIGDTEGLIPNQKSINFMIAMMLLSQQHLGWPKAVINPQYVNPNSLNNDPTVPIVDTSPPGQDGIKYLQPTAPSGLAKELVDMFIDYTKTLSSAQDAATGDVSKGNLNATAIMLLQKASGVPIESIKRRFYRAMEDVGRVWEEFWKVKYNTTRRVNLEDDDGKAYSADFRGADYADVNMNLKIDIGPSSSYSEELSMASLDKLYEKQAISTEQYLEFAPKNVVPFKDRLLKQLKLQQEQQMQAQAMMAQMQQQQQIDPNQQAAEQMQMQEVAKDTDHQRKIELENVKANNQLRLAQINRANA